MESSVRKRWSNIGRKYRKRGKTFLPKRLHYSEIFTSIQGEGLYVGTPSVFLRLFGCNLTCSGFSASSQQVEAKDSIIVSDKITELDPNDFAVGCDSRYSWHQDYKKFRQSYNPATVITEIEKELAKFPNIHSLIITGGEPLLQQEALAHVLYLIAGRITNVTFETNGTRIIKNTLSSAIIDLLDSISVHFSNSPKLAHSGEKYSTRVNWKALYSQTMLGASITKYVARPLKEDFDEISKLQEFYSSKGVEMKTPYVMPLGATLQQYRNNAPTVAALCLDYGFIFCPRLHVELWDNAIGT